MITNSEKIQLTLKFIILFILTLTTLPMLYAKSQTGGLSVAKYSGEFMAIGVGGRALALGGAYVALANDVTAGYWNPAGLSELMYPQISLMHDERFAGLINYDYGAIAFPMGINASIGVSVVRLGIDNIPDTRYAGVDANGDPLSPDQWQNFISLDQSKITYFNVADWVIYLSYANRMNTKFSYGTNLKIIRREFELASATGLGFDVGVLYQLTDRFRIGANLQDITTTFISWSTGKNELVSPTMKLGGAYFIDAFSGRFAPVIGVDIRFENRMYASNFHIGSMSFDFKTGLEFDFRNLIALRVGYSEIGSLNIGTGIHLPKLDIDYSFAKFNTSDQLGNTHRISLIFTMHSERFLRASTNL